MKSPGLSGPAVKLGRGGGLGAVMANRKALLLVIIVASLSGCHHAVTYYNPQIEDGAFLQRQFTIDDGYCTSAAAGSVPIPQVRIYTPPPNNYSFSGQATTYNPYSGYSTTTYQGTAHSYPTSGFAQGFANGMNIGAAMAARKKQDRVYHACMVALGWTTNKGEVESLRASYSARRQHAEEEQSARDKAEEEIEEAKIQEAIDSIPELKHWQDHDTERWTLAAEIDKELRESGNYRGVPYRDRFLVVVQRVKKQITAKKK